MESPDGGAAVAEGLREGERVLPPTRRPDGTMRKAIRIRAGYVPQDEVAIYQSKGAMIRKGAPQVPPGYDPVEDLPQKPKTKSAKKNEKRKEKKHQAATTSTSQADDETTYCSSENYGAATDPHIEERNNVNSVAQQFGSLNVSKNSGKDFPPANSLEKSDLEKRIRALRKKIRLTESLQISLASKGVGLNKEQAEKVARLEEWWKEMNALESQVKLM